MVKRLARKKTEEAPKGAPEWMTTFSDLMNLLLCFFVLLFAMSNVDQEKFDQVAASLSSSFSIFSGGKSSIGDGQLINMGVAQLNDFNQYFSNMGQTTESIDGEEIEQLKQLLAEANKAETEKMYDNITEMSAQYNLDKYLDIETDKTGGQYVLINISGSLLYDSGKAKLKDEALPIFSKVGD
ncbi:MAG TPA: chemotaxis protein, partial [Lachnoclostridium phytofermentans]|nr:chemotaxis protein [Lachnoclostridium phytofermentans]